MAARRPRPKNRQGGRPRRPSSRPGPKRSPGGRRDTRASRASGAADTSGAARVEGRHAVRELLLAGTRRTREIRLAAGLEPAPIIDDIRELAAELRVPIRELGRGAFDADAHTDSSQGVIADADPLPSVDLDELLDRTAVPFLVMVDGVTDPHNLGAIFRTADAAGASAVVLPRHRSARISATVAKTAAGAVEHVPVVTVAGVPAAISRLKDRAVWTVGLDESGTRSIFGLDLAVEPICLVFGSEGPGLSRLTRERCDQLVSIPMRGGVASLNVSAAAAVAMFEVARRR